MHILIIPAWTTSIAYAQPGGTRLDGSTAQGIQLRAVQRIPELQGGIEAGNADEEIPQMIGSIPGVFKACDYSR